MLQLLPNRRPNPLKKDFYLITIEIQALFIEMADPNEIADLIEFIDEGDCPNDDWKVCFEKIKQSISEYKKCKGTEIKQSVDNLKEFIINQQVIFLLAILVLCLYNYCYEFSQNSLLLVSLWEGLKLTLFVKNLHS